MKNNNTIVVAGSDGLIGSAIAEYLNEKNYKVLGIDPISNGIDITCALTVKNLFSMHNITGFVNCAYPRDFQQHCEVYMSANNNFAHNFSAKEFGSIVNMASIYGIVGPDDRIYQDNEIYMPDWYAGAKGAIIAHSRCLATRYAKHNVRINCLALGGVHDNQPLNFIQKYNNRVPLNRMARTSDIVGIVEFLLSDKSSYITGQCIPVDGGLVSW